MVQVLDCKPRGSGSVHVDFIPGLPFHWAIPKEEHLGCIFRDPMVLKGVFKPVQRLGMMPQGTTAKSSLHGVRRLHYSARLLLVNVKCPCCPPLKCLNCIFCVLFCAEQFSHMGYLDDASSFIPSPPTVVLISLSASKSTQHDTLFASA